MDGGRRGGAGRRRSKLQALLYDILLPRVPKSENWECETGGGGREGGEGVWGEGAVGVCNRKERNIFTLH